MIEQIYLADEATYLLTHGQSLNKLREVNFIFGENGTGKTTISRLIQAPSSMPNCYIKWKNDIEVDTLVYNCDFINNNYISQMPGIFTLGESSVDKEHQIKKLNLDIDKLTEDISNLQNRLGPSVSGSKQDELTTLNTQFKEDCWSIKNKHDEYFKDAFSHYRGSKEVFCKKILEESNSNNIELISLDQLKDKSHSIFKEGHQSLSLVSNVDGSKLVGLEESTILSKTIIGKDDVNIALLINKLNSSDWVKQGLEFFNESSNYCPFCQQTVTSELYNQLNAYFDETYVADLSKLDDLQILYTDQSLALIDSIEMLTTLNNRYLELEAINTLLKQLSDRIEINKQRISQKKQQPSLKINLSGISDFIDELSAIIDNANVQTLAHNQLIENLHREKESLKAQIWAYIVDENKTLINRHKTDTENLRRAISNIEIQIVNKKNEKKSAQELLWAFEKSITSVQPTVNAINSTLKSFGFTSFSLTTAGSNNNQYALVRNDGSNAVSTLSEGEKSFITFLYFYHLIRGSLSESGQSANRIIVFDDPVSSLDSNVLFIISTLIKKVIKEACLNTGNVKQVFLLTHNIYFHKEVSFDSKRGLECRSHESFWIIRKSYTQSIITGYDYNPIKTSYEFLWDQVRDADNIDQSNILLQNVLRRILESYFKITGNREFEKIIELFTGTDQLICSSLFSWIHDGSHSTSDDLYISVDDQTIAQYLKVFKKIFEKTDHINHYYMMMKIDSESVIQEFESATELIESI